MNGESSNSIDHRLSLLRQACLKIKKSKADTLGAVMLANSDAVPVFSYIMGPVAMHYNVLGAAQRILNEMVRSKAGIYPTGCRIAMNAPPENNGLGVRDIRSLNKAMAISYMETCLTTEDDLCRITTAIHIAQIEASLTGKETGKQVLDPTKGQIHHRNKAWNGHPLFYRQCHEALKSCDFRLILSPRNTNLNISNIKEKIAPYLPTGARNGCWK
jgi:hypothetical protein